jgi:hypothetical protein
MFTARRSCRSRCWYPVSRSDLYFDRQGDFSLRETSSTSSQPLCTITQTLAAKRHSRRETTLETDRAARETVKGASKPPDQQTDHHRVPTCTYRTGTVDRHPRRTAKGQSEFHQRRARPTVCIRNGPLPNCMRSLATRPSFQDHKPSKWMQITPQKLVLSVGTHPMRTVHTKGCSLSVRTRTVGTRCMLIWSVRGILPCERSCFDRIGARRGTCQLPLMHRTKKPKLHACKGMQSCGGVQM